MAKTEVVRAVGEKREMTRRERWPTSGKTRSSFIVATYSVTVVLLQVVVNACIVDQGIDSTREKQL